MTLAIFDRVKETSTSSGTGVINLGGATTGFQSFSTVIPSGSATCYYAIQAVDTNGNPTGQWETGLGTYTNTGNTLARTTVAQSSNANALVSFSGTLHIFMTLTAAQLAGWSTVSGISYGNGSGVFSTATAAQVVSAIGTTAVTNATNAATLTGTNAIANGGTGATTAAGALTNLGVSGVYAPLASPALTGTPTAPTVATADNSTSISTTAFLKAQNYITSATAPVQSVFGRTGAVTLTSSDVTTALTFTPVSNSVLAQPSGVATLDSNGKLLTAQTPAALVGAVVYQGTWNASTNTPTFTSGTGTKGYYFKVATAGTTTIDGISQWNIGDTIIFNGTTWDKIDGIASEVVNVAGRTGTVVLAVADVSGAATSGANSNITSLTGLTTALSVLQGGTGTTTATGTGSTVLSASPTFTGTVTAPTFSGALTGNASGTAANVTGTVAIANGGTGATTASAALTALGAAGLASPTFTGTVTAPTFSGSLTGNASGTAANVTGTVAVANGGTGATTAAGALTNLGVSGVYAPLASPALTGTPSSPTAAVDTSTTQVATTAFVLAQAASVAPVADGTATLGVSTRYARQDHAHGLPVASSTVLGVVKQGANITIDASGVISAGNSYTLPTASSTVLGGVKVGANLSIDGTGVLSASNSYVLPAATSSTLGGIKVGTGLTVDGTGLVTNNIGAGTRTVSLTIATAGQTVFTVVGGYAATLIDVRLNGYSLPANDYTATNGTTITLGTACVAGDEVETVVFASQSFTSGSTITRQTAFATDLQTSFAITGGYTVGNIDVIQNGILLYPSDYTATDGANVVLTKAVVANTEMLFRVFSTLALTGSVASTGGTMSGALVVSADIQSTSQNGGQLAGLRNRIINGDMRIDQRNNGAAITPLAATNPYHVDRFQIAAAQASKLTFQQVVDAPPTFTYSTKITVAAQYAPVAADYFQYRQPIETQNITDFAFGTASASQVTISLWVKGSVPGVYSVSLGQGPVNRTYIGTVNVTTAWAKQTVTLLGDTAGTWGTGNGIGAYLAIDLGSGTNSNAAAGSWQAGGFSRTASSVTFVNQVAGSTLNITGVQLELGSAATPFEQRPISYELAACLRYYQIVQATIRFLATSGSQNTSAPLPYQVTMRAAPTAVVGTAAASNNLSGAVSVARVTSYGADSNIASAAAGDTYALGLPISLNAEL